jgi:predicted Zn-ribbon and HTH transcriptional regulator
MDNNVRLIKTEEELKVFSDPYRLKIIHVFQSSSKPLTVKGCADVMGEVPAKVYYHVQKLIRIKILELDHIEVINGINAKYYKLVKERFSVKLNNDNHQNMYSQLSHVQKLLVLKLECFQGQTST